MECLRTGLPRELVPHPEISVKMEKVNGSLKSFHCTLPSLTLCPPPSSMVWAQVILPSNTWQWGWRTRIEPCGCHWCSVWYTVFATQTGAPLSVCLTLSHIRTHTLDAFYLFKYKVLCSLKKNAKPCRPTGVLTVCMDCSGQLWPVSLGRSILGWELEFRGLAILRW